MTIKNTWGLVWFDAFGFVYDVMSEFMQFMVSVFYMWVPKFVIFKYLELLTEWSE